MGKFVYECYGDVFIYLRHPGGEIIKKAVQSVARVGGYGGLLVELSSEPMRYYLLDRKELTCSYTRLPSDLYDILRGRGGYPPGPVTYHGFTYFPRRLEQHRKAFATNIYEYFVRLPNIDKLNV